MQEHLRTGIGSPARVASRRRLYTEALNPFFGFFYTVKKSLHKSKTAYQNIELIDTDEFGKVLLLDNITQVAERNDYLYHEPMVHPALCSHPKPKAVLVIGGGDGGILREVLKYPVVERVVLAELDEGVIEFSKKYLGSVHGGAFDDPRLEIRIVDGRRYTEEHPGEFDVVIMDMTDPFGPSRMLYTREFYKRVKKSFRDRNGVFVMHSESPISRPSAYTCILRTLGSAFTRVVPLYLYIQMYSMLWSISVCSEDLDIAAIKPSVIDRRLARYGIQGLQVYTGATQCSMQVPFPFLSEITKRPARIITDSKPDFPDDFLSVS